MIKGTSKIGLLFCLSGTRPCHTLTGTHAHDKPCEHNPPFIRDEDVIEALYISIENIGDDDQRRADHQRLLIPISSIGDVSDQR